MSDAPRATAVITGASRGIGREIARVLAADGFRVFLLARTESALRATAQEIGANATALPCDLADPAAVQRAADRILSELGAAPDVVVNNAGAFKLAPVAETDPFEFRESLDVNLVGPFLLVRAFLPGMRARGSGHIVSIGSIADRVIFPENGAYAASKFGARALHEVMRVELRGTGVRTTLVSPGAVDTALWDAIDPDTRPGFTPRREMLRPSDVADAVRYVIQTPARVNIDELRLSHT